MVSPHQCAFNCVQTLIIFHLVLYGKTFFHALSLPLPHNPRCLSSWTWSMELTGRRRRSTGILDISSTILNRFSNRSQTIFQVSPGRVQIGPSIRFTHGSLMHTVILERPTSVLFSWIKTSHIIIRRRLTAVGAGDFVGEGSKLDGFR